MRFVGEELLAIVPVPEDQSQPHAEEQFTSDSLQ